MNCKWVERHLHRILDRELTPGQHRALEEHLSQCSQCTNALRSASAEEQSFKAAMLRPTAPAPLISDVMGRLDQPAPPRRTRLVWWASAAAAVLLMCLLVAQRAGHKAASDRLHPTTGWKLVEFSGPVSVRQTLDAEWADATPGQKLEMGAHLRTGDGALAVVRLANWATVKADADALLRLDRGGVFLESSRLFAWVDRTGHAFEVDTGHATAAVRGTAFCVDQRSAEHTTLSVVDGLVELCNGLGRVEVPAGMQAHAGDDAPGRPMHADLFDAVRWAGIEDDALAFPVDVRIRVRLEADTDVLTEGPVTFTVEADYGRTFYADLPVRCRVTNAAGQALAQASERLCNQSYRYRIRKITIPALPPGSYQASFQMGHGRHAVVEELDFSVE